MPHLLMDQRRTSLVLLFAWALWLLPVVYASHSDETITNSNSDGSSYQQPPSPSPYNPSHPSHTQSSSPPSRSWGSGAGNGIDFLVAAFFLIAAGWLVLALIYSILVLIVVRMRARGQLDVYDENFGRLYLFGTRMYLPFGCVLRRYVIAMNRERNRDGDPITVRLMTREERRLAMEKLLLQDGSHKCEGGEVTVTADDKDENKAVISNDEESGDNDESPETKTQENENNQDDDASEEEPVCTICLNEYEPTDDCFTSSVCSHQFHRTCILEWLQRRANTECPVCRAPLVTDDQVWETVQQMRQERRRQLQKANRGGFFSRFIGARGRQQSTTTVRRAEDDVTIEPTPPPSPSPTALSSLSGDLAQNVSDVESGQIDRNEEVVQTLHYD